MTTESIDRLVDRGNGNAINFKLFHGRLKNVVGDFPSITVAFFP
jgi:hypothetical protein